jgi:hypothetical protein
MHWLPALLLFLCVPSAFAAEDPVPAKDYDYTILLTREKLCFGPSGGISLECEPLQPEYQAFPANIPSLHENLQQAEWEMRRMLKQHMVDAVWPTGVVIQCSPDLEYGYAANCFYLVVSAGISRITLQTGDAVSPLSPLSAMERVSFPTMIDAIPEIRVEKTVKISLGFEEFDAGIPEQITMSILKRYLTKPDTLALSVRSTFLGESGEDIEMQKRIARTVMVNFPVTAPTGRFAALAKTLLQLFPFQINPGVVRQKDGG